MIQGKYTFDIDSGLLIRFNELFSTAPES